MSDSYHYDVEGEESPQLLLRVINLLVQADASLETVSLTRADGAFRIGARVSAITAERADIVAEKMRSLVQVSCVACHGGG